LRLARTSLLLFSSSFLSLRSLRRGALPNAIDPESFPLSAPHLRGVYTYAERNFQQGPSAHPPKRFLGWFYTTPKKSPQNPRTQSLNNFHPGCSQKARTVDSHHSSSRSFSFFAFPSLFFLSDPAFSTPPLNLLPRSL